MANETWALDVSHSRVGFSVRHLMVSKVHGNFDAFEGSVTTSGDDFSQAKVQASVDIGSINTREAQRDGHLKSADFFDAEHHPKMTFTSTRITKVDAENVKLEGDLTIRGNTKPVSFDVEYLGRTKDPWGGERIGFSAKTSINRKDFGLGWNQALEAGGVVVGEKVEITIEVEAIRKAG